MKNYPYSKEIMDCGWAIGVAIALLQLMTFLAPEGEGRDWIYYLLAALWAGWLVLVPLAARMGLHVPAVHPYGIKPVMTAYAAAVISYYFIVPLFDRMFLWVWLLAPLVACAWGRRLRGVDLRARIVCMAGAAWFLLAAVSLTGSLLYRSTWFGLMSNRSLLTSALPYVFSLAIIVPAAYLALRRPYGDEVRKPLPRPVNALLHLLAAYLLMVPLFRVDGLMRAVSYHHWKAFLEPAESVRAGAWLLWDVPAQYGFGLTALLAAFPAATTWQSLYLVNGALLTLTGYMLFFALFARYRSLPGYLFSLLIAVACVAQVLPFIDSRMMPSTGAIRFIWLYVLVGYVTYLQFCIRLPRWSYAAGNALWLAGVLWSLEGAVMASIVWLPSLALVAVSEKTHATWPVMIRHALMKLAGAISCLAAAVIGISVFYYANIGHLPDLQLYTAYATGYASGFNTYPIIDLDIAVCWLCVFVMMALLMRRFAAHASLNSANVMRFAALYAALAGLWAAVSMYVPVSDDVHLAGTLPVMVYLGTLVLLVLPSLPMPAFTKAAYEKVMVCLFVVLSLGTVNCFKPGLYTEQSLASPVHGDVTAVFPEPPQFMLDILEKADVPDGSRVMILSQPFSLEEGAIFRGRHYLSWLLPNTEVSFDKPLPPELYGTIAHRRAQRMEAGTAWLVERKDYPLARYPWIESAINAYYTETLQVENSEYRIRRYEKRL